MLLWQLWDYDKLYWDGIPDEVVYAAVLLFHWKLPVLFQLAEHVPWIMVAYKGDCQLICRDQIYCLRIWFVKTGVCIGLVKIINVKVVFRWFVLYDIILPEDPPDILSEFYVFFIFDQHIDLHWLFWDEMFRIKFQIFCFVSEFDLQYRIKCRCHWIFSSLVFNPIPPFMIIECCVFFNA